MLSFFTDPRDLLISIQGTGSMVTSVKRTIKPRALSAPIGEWPSNVPEPIKRIYATRGVLSYNDNPQGLSSLHPAKLLSGIEEAAQLLAKAITENRRIMVSGDYDCDGATGSSVAVRGLRLLGAKEVRFIVPDRFKHGYGLTPALVEAMGDWPELIVTVDSGVSSIDGVACARSRGTDVIVTDHHLPAETLPNANAMVNPNLKGDTYPSKALAGVGVIFHLLLVTRGVLRPQAMPESLASLLDLVAIGTVADLVPLDQNNRLLVEAGLNRIRQGLAHEGVKALLEVAGKDYRTLDASDIAFGIGPRLNAAGRLEDMTVGVQTLLCDDPSEAKRLATQLDSINKQRKELQADMVAEAEAIADRTQTDASTGVVVYDPTWHAGVVGLVASKLKETLYRPVVAFAPGESGSNEVRGSGRSIEGFHLRDALALIDARHPGLILKFGGHAMAAGLSLAEADIPLFTEAFNQVATESLTQEQLESVVLTDGSLPPELLNLDFAKYLRQWGPWGQKFPEPVFEDTFNVIEHRVLGEKHLSLELVDPRSGYTYKAIYFNSYQGIEPPPRVKLAYKLSVNAWKGRESLQLMVEAMEAA